MDDLIYLLNLLPHFNETDNLLAGKLDIERIGLIGHSLGGAAVYRVLKNTDVCIKASVLLDPSLHLFGEDSLMLDVPVLQSQRKEP